MNITKENLFQEGPWKGVPDNKKLQKQEPERIEAEEHCSDITIVPNTNTG